MCFHNIRHKSCTFYIMVTGSFTNTEMPLRITSQVSKNTLLSCNIVIHNQWPGHEAILISSINSSPPSVAYMRRWTESAFIQVMACRLGAVSIRKTVLPGMAIPMLKIRRPNGRLIFNMEIAIRR